MAVHLTADARRLADEYGESTTNILALKGVTPQSIDGASICSVVPPLTSTFEEVCKEYFNVVPLTVNTGVKTGVRILYDNPRDVGADRVVLGSDWPFVGWDPSPPGWVNSLKSLTGEEKEKILWKNLETLLGI